MRKLVGSIIRTNKIFNFIKNNDKILVGVSGGKDSTLLLKALTLYSQYVNHKYGWNIKIYGLHIKMNYYNNIDYTEFKKYLKQNKLNVKFVESDIGDILKAKVKKGLVQCSLCAKLKKAILVKEAKKIGAKIIATGHHADDAIETLFLNMIHEGRIATFSPYIYFDRSNTYLIRPFILLREKDIIKEAKKQKIPVIENSCPRETNTERIFIKKFLETNFYKNKIFNMSYNNFLVALLNGKQSTLWFDNKSKKKDLIKKLNEF